MLGSKVLNFFFFEFFPVWDTEEWIRKRVFSKLSRPEAMEMRTAIKAQLPQKGKYSDSGLQYATYVELTLDDLAGVSSTQYEAVRNLCVKHLCQ